MIPEQAHGSIVLVDSACTSCMICVRECPTWCIELASHTVQVSEPGARRPRSVNVLEAFTIDFGLCMFCGICIDVCPFDALAWTPGFEAAGQNLVQSLTDPPSAGKDSVG